MEAGSYTSLYLANPLSYLFNSTLCYVVSGLAILVVGVIITSVTFQNLDPYHESNKERYAGPVLMGAGILVMGRGAFYRLKQQDCRGGASRHRCFMRRLMACWRPQEDSEAAAIYLEPTDPEDLLYDDDPPPYHLVANESPRPVVPSQRSISSAMDPSLAITGGAMDNPALDMEEEEEDMLPPPPYEEVMHINQTHL